MIREDDDYDAVDGVYNNNCQELSGRDMMTPSIFTCCMFNNGEFNTICTHLDPAKFIYA